METLRLELKQWERQFAQKNGGTVPTRDDIKRDPEIAAKYLRYSTSRSVGQCKRKRKSVDKCLQKVTNDKESNKCSCDNPPAPRGLNLVESSITREDIIPPTQPDDLSSDKTAEKKSTLEMHTKESNMTPSKSSQRYSSSAFDVCELGPTPQKNGKVRGIFDILLNEKNASNIIQSNHHNQGSSSSSPRATPRRCHSTMNNEQSTSPLSADRKSGVDCLRDDFKNQIPATPRHKSLPQDEKTFTPTPHFLKMKTIDLNQIARDPAQMKLKGTKLPSTLIQELQKLQNEHLGPDEKTMRELQESHTQQGDNDDPEIYITKNEPVSYQKKGRKRTSKRVKMRPAVSHDSLRIKMADDGQAEVPETSSQSVKVGKSLMRQNKFGLAIGRQVSGNYRTHGLRRGGRGGRRRI